MIHRGCAVIFLLGLFLPSRMADRECQPIRIDSCRDLGYNVTAMPNLVGHELQQDAQMQLQTFTPLVQYGCSSRLRFFLCSVYVPMCTEKVPFPIGPCRSLCEDVRNLCQPVLQEFGFPWPAGLNCSKFPPQNNDKHMCMEGPANSKGQDQNVKANKLWPRRPIPKLQEMTSYKKMIPVPDKRRFQDYGLCKAFRFPKQYYYINRTGRCVPHCMADLNFSHDNKMFANYWVAVWAGLCFVSTLFTLLTFLIDDARIQYPEGAVVFLCACYNVCSLAYFIRLLVGRHETSCHIESQHEVPVLVQENLENVNCTIVFVMLYYFGMAGALWWVVLTIMWYFSAGLGWNGKTLERYRTYFHLLAWSVPSALTITVIVMGIVDADELVGSCYVGNQNMQNLLFFVMLPSVIYLLIGISFLGMGLVKVFQKQKDIPEACHPLYKAQKMDPMTKRIGIFAILYIIPAMCVLASNFYEYYWHSVWVAAGSTSRPNVEVFTLKIFMSLVIGLTTGLWVSSSKNPITTWKKLYHRMSPQKEPLPSYLNIKPQNVPHERVKKSLSKASSETIV